MSYSTNRFSALEVDDEITVIDTIRKAAKKLKEIERLKQKSSHTQEEITKINTEMFWRNILSPPAPKPNQESEKRKARRAKEDEERARAKEAKAKEDEERARAKEAKARTEKERAKNQKQERRNYFIDNLSDPVEIEYWETMKKNGHNIEKTFRFLSKKYHPDRNFGRQEWSEKMQKHLFTVKEKFLNIL